MSQGNDSSRFGPDTQAAIASAASLVRRRRVRAEAPIMLGALRAALLEYQRVVTEDVERALGLLKQLEPWAHGGPVPEVAQRYAALLDAYDGPDLSQASTEAGQELDADYGNDLYMTDRVTSLLEMAGGDGEGPYGTERFLEDLFEDIAHSLSSIRAADRVRQATLAAVEQATRPERSRSIRPRPLRTNAVCSVANGVEVHS